MLRKSTIALIFLSCSLLLAQKPELQRQGKGGYVISVDTTLIQIPVFVHDKEGRPVNNLKEEHFQVFEDKTPQKIKLFAHEDVPLSLGLVIDNSGSMRSKRERVNSAALSFVRESNPEDETFIVNFDDSAYLEQEFTGSIGDLMDSLDNLDTRGETALYDAVYLSVDKVIKDGKRDSKALLLVSDGEDNTSKYKLEQVIKRLKEAKVTVYAIGLLKDNDQRGGLFKAPPSKKARQVLSTFAEATGGVAYFPKSLDEVEELCKQIAHDLRNRYTLGYSPTNDKLDGTVRDVRVAVTPPKTAAKAELTVRWKTSYYAPSGPPSNKN